MATHDPTPAVYRAATVIAAADSISVDEALSRLHRAARRAGLSPERLASQVVVETSTPRDCDGLAMRPVDGGQANA